MTSTTSPMSNPAVISKHLSDKRALLAVEGAARLPAKTWQQHGCFVACLSEATARSPMKWLAQEAPLADHLGVLPLKHHRLRHLQQ